MEVRREGLTVGGEAGDGEAFKAVGYREKLVVSSRYVGETCGERCEARSTLRTLRLENYHRL